MIEVKSGEGWRSIGQVPGDRSGSLSNNTPTGREVIHFTCHGEHSTIERSIGGVDTEIGLLRKTLTVGLEELARLGAGDVHELDLQTDRMTRPARFRFRHEAQR